LSKHPASLLEAITESFRAALRPSSNEATPVALLWTDADGQWLPLLSSLRTVLPSLYTLGRLDRETRTGPAIWLKCIVGRTLPEAPPPGEIPVLYLPHVSRQELRAAGDCPPKLQPLVELQYRGRVWHQTNGSDWTVRAFLIAEAGLGLDVVGDRRTEEAFLRVLPWLAESDLQALKGRRLDADDFDKLSVEDPVRDMLRWLDNPQGFETAAKGSRWESFRALSKSEFGIYPDQTSPAEIAALLLRSDPKLDRIWSRFSEAPQLYPGVAKRLRDPISVGQGMLGLDPSRDPRINEAEEGDLRRELEKVASIPHLDACRRVLELETRHGARREWLWARTGQSPWAMALRPLVRLANSAQKPIGGATIDLAAAIYAENGWPTDAAAMEALACFSHSGDAVVMSKVVRALYEPWLDASARHFQFLVAADPDEARKAVGVCRSEKDTCLLFVDGLRMDIAGQLAARLESHAFRVTLAHRLAPLPTVTATAKPAASPIANDIKGDSGEDFTPLIKLKSQWKPLIASLFRDRLEKEGLEILDASELLIPSGTNAGGWTECGAIDSMGHSLQGDLVHQIETELKRIEDRVSSLLNSGWRRVHIVTDHGWLLLPGGLPRIDLPGYLVETKWARCAVVKGQPDLPVPVSIWYWNPAIRIASPPGIGSFRANETYAHGGISPQECVVPDLLVERGVTAIYATITSIEWRRMRCRIRVETNNPSVRVDLRKNWKEQTTSIMAAHKALDANGEVSLVLDDTHEGAAASVVVVDVDGNVITHQTTCVGEKT
jgi:hypothetical protein